MINGKISQLNNKNGETMFPITSSSAVMMKDGSTTVEDKMNDFNSSFEKIAVTSQISNTLSKINSGQSVDIVFIGDSTVQGIQHTTADKTYVALFANKLKEIYPNINIKRVDGQAVSPASNNQIDSWNEVDVNIVTGTTQTIRVIKSAVGGDTVSRIQRRVADLTVQCPSGKADLVFLCVGINDSLEDANKYVPPLQYEKGLSAIIGYLKRTNNCDLVLLTSNWCGTSLENQTITEYVKAQKRVGKSFKAQIIDVNKMWIEHYRPNNGVYGQGDWLTDGDDCHPTENGHKAIFGLIEKEIFPPNLKIVGSSNEELYFVDFNNSKKSINYTGNWSLKTFRKNSRTEYGAFETNTINDSVTLNLMGKKAYLLTRLSKNTGRFKIKVNDEPEKIVDLNTTYPILPDDTTDDLNGYFYVRIPLFEKNTNKANSVIVTNLENKTLSVMGIEVDHPQIVQSCSNYNVGENGTTELMNGFIIQWGVITNISESGVINLNQPFPNGLKNAQLTCFSLEGNPIASIGLGGDGKTKIGYKVNFNGATPSTSTIYWTAIGY